MINHNFQLTPEEKNAMRERLLMFIKKHPVMTGWSPRYYYWSNVLANFKLSFIKTMPIILTLVILLSGGVSLGAEGSLPGDFLYPVKTGVNEEVRAWFAVSDESEATWSARRAERRLEEAERMAVEGRFNEDARLHIEENFLAHADRVRARVDKFEDSNHAKALEVNSSFQTSLDVHTRILESIGISLDAEVEPILVKLASRVKKEKEEVGEDREDGEARIRSGFRAELTLRAAEGKLTAASNKIEEVRKFISRHSEEISAEDKIKIEANLKLADNAVAEGKMRIDSGAYNEAFLLFQRAHNFAQETKLLVQAKIRFEVRGSDEGENDDNDEATASPTASPETTPTPTTSPPRSVSPRPTPSTSPDITIQGRVKIRLDF